VHLHFSATAPLTAFARKYGFRGATLHGLNEIILRTGLSVDYDEVSRDAEKLRLGLTRADRFEIDFEVLGERPRLTLHCGGQEAQKSHGLCRGEKPDVANLPAGEVYFVPHGAEGVFPMRYEDGTIGLMEVAGGRMQKRPCCAASKASLTSTIASSNPIPSRAKSANWDLARRNCRRRAATFRTKKSWARCTSPPAAATIWEGILTPDKFAEAKNATHDDILFSPTKTPEIRVTQARMYRGAQQETVIENYQPSAYLRRLLAS
jgi:aminopeptidase